MIAKLALWLFLSLLVCSLVASLGFLLAGCWQALGLAASLSVFFAAAAWLAEPAVEAFNNDRDWKRARAWRG